MNQQQYQDREICLYWVGLQERLARGELEVKIFDDVDCMSCTPDKQSSILCPYYQNKVHLEEFRQIFKRVNG